MRQNIIQSKKKAYSDKTVLQPSVYALFQNPRITVLLTLHLLLLGLADIVVYNTTYLSKDKVDTLQSFSDGGTKVSEVYIWFQKSNGHPRISENCV